MGAISGARAAPMRGVLNGFLASGLEGIFHFLGSAIPKRRGGCEARRRLEKAIIIGTTMNITSPAPLCLKNRSHRAKMPYLPRPVPGVRLEKFRDCGSVG